MAAENAIGVSAGDVERSYSLYAAPLVGPFYRAVNTTPDDPGATEKALVDAFESTLKYLAIVLVAQYRADGVDVPRIREALSGLARPSLGTYASLLRDLIKLYRKSDLPLLAGMAGFYDDRVDDATFEHVQALSDVAGYPTPKNARSYKQLMDVFVTYRNRCVGHGAAAAREEYTRRLPHLAGALSALLGRIRFAAELPLTEVQSGRRTSEGTSYDVRRWNGLLPKAETVQLPDDPPIGHLLLRTPGAEGDDDGGSLLDLFPFCAALRNERTRSDDVFFLNGARKTKVSYLSYNSGDEQAATSSHPAFKDMQAGISDLAVAEGGAGLPEHMLAKLEVSDESRAHYNRAQAELAGGDAGSAIALLEFAVGKSPGYRDAVQLLVSLKESEGLSAEAHEALDDYLALLPGDIGFLLADARLLIGLRRHEEAEGRLREVLAADPENTEAKDLEQKLKDLSRAPVGEAPAEASSAGMLLAYEFLAQALTGSTRPAKWLLAALVVSLTAAEFAAFYFYGDLVMALTACSMGVLWGATLWATFRIRRLLADSRHNFAAFLRSRKGTDPAQLFDEMVSPVFGSYPGEGRGARHLWSGLRRNGLRAVVVLACSALATAWFFLITKYSPFSLVVDAAFGVFCFLFSISFVYLMSCAVAFHRLLKQLRFQQIHFSLVQHPKLSIRYVSHLSRRVTYPLLVIYALASCTLYLGPFLANIAFIAAMSVLVILICYTYYSTIFLVRRVIIQNKWRLISQFSVHFDEPFNNLVTRARPGDMARIKELVEMRDFIDSLDVWAERRVVLLAMSLLYFAVLAFSTIGMSNAMTRHIMPALSRYANRATGKAGETAYDVARGVPGIDVRVKDVDDAVIVCWGDTVEAMVDRAHCLVGERFKELPAPAVGPSGFRRCDHLLSTHAARRQESRWAAGMHGSMDFTIPCGTEKHVLVVAYNKVFHGLLWMGGGKLSYDVELACGGNRLLRKRRFVRINTREIAYVAHLRVRREGGRVTVLTREGEKVDDARIRDFLGWLEGELAKEKDAGTALAVPGG